MILQALVHLYDALSAEGKIARDGWCPGKVAYYLEIDDDGHLLNAVSAMEEKQRGKKTVLLPKVLTIPQQVKRSVQVAPNFLCDTSSYILGMDDKGKPDRTKQCFEAARMLHHTVLDHCTAPAAKAVLRFFDTWKPEQAGQYPFIAAYKEDILSAGMMIFQYHGQNVQDDQDVRAAWQAYWDKKAEDDTIPREQCLVTGEEAPVTILHPVIKGVRGAQSSGASLVSFNAPSFESYGNDKSQGLNAPVSRHAAFAYGTALNHLLADQDHVQFLGDTTVVYWAESGEAAPQDMFGFMVDGQTEKIHDADLQSILQKMVQGEPCDLSQIRIDPNEPFYILGLAPNAARVSVRFFLRNTFGKIMDHLLEHQNRMKIIGRRDQSNMLIPMWLLLKQTVSPHTKDAASSPLLAGELMRSILTGSAYPEAMFQNIMLRIFADQDEYNENGTRTFDKTGQVRAAFIKAYLLRNHTTRWESEIKMTVNDHCKEISYVLGRLFSVLENVQQVANPGINATIKNRYFNSACATPASIFPILLKLANAHLNKLEIGQQIYYSKKIGQLLADITMPNEGTPLPNRLNLEEQGAFVLGYYQETQDRYTKKEEA